MMPVLAIVSIRRPGSGFSLWAPLILLWPVLAVVALIFAPFWTVYVLARRRNPAAVAGGICGLVLSLKGAAVEVDSPSASVRVRLI